MTIGDIVAKLNGDFKAKEVAESVGISQSTLSRKLKNLGYVYDNKSKLYDFAGSEEDKINIDRMEVSEFKSEKVAKKVVKKSEKIQNEVKGNSDENLSEDEIKFVKELYKGRTNRDKEFELNYEFSKLPSRKPERKTSYIISKETFEEFESFAKKLAEENRMSKNDFVEIALRRFMKDFK